ncbi:hypothetical protein PVAP13_5NG556900 [Panicum virgatum]|uniref:NAC domain-containing protein n=1 Tax=Panicum virgatum TaxID=38727 RepID=A0A8T0S4D9_PANVG|nr:hypothetical protein PVAP13_5NG556900 [Panicum virgatum]
MAMAAAAAAAEGSGHRDAEAELNLPPGFRFHPTDEELVVHYLCRKVARQQLPVPIIAEVDLYKFDPWNLPEKALFGRKEWYFFTPRDRKYPNGSRPNRAAGTGYWKATGADKPITPKGCARAAGIKKALVFYSGKAPRGVKTDWIMHEYRLADADRAPGKKGSQKVRGHGPLHSSGCVPWWCSVFARRAFPLGLLVLESLTSFLFRSWTSGCCAGCTTRRTTGRR